MQRSIWLNKGQWKANNQIARSSNNSRGIISSALILVASKSTGQASPLFNASSQVLAHTHQESPGFSPGKLKCGAGVIKSLPLDFANLRNSSVTIAQTVCDPLSFSSVLQDPSRYQPVRGLHEHSPMSCPNTFFCAAMIPCHSNSTSNYVWFHSSTWERLLLLRDFFSKNSICEFTDRSSSSAHCFKAAWSLGSNLSNSFFFSIFIPSSASIEATHNQSDCYHYVENYAKPECFGSIFSSYPTLSFCMNALIYPAEASVY